MFARHKSEYCVFPGTINIRRITLNLKQIYFSLIVQRNMAALKRSQHSLIPRNWRLLLMSHVLISNSDVAAGNIWMWRHFIYIFGQLPSQINRRGSLRGFLFKASAVNVNRTWFGNIFVTAGVEQMLRKEVKAVFRRMHPGYTHTHAEKLL